MKKHLTGLFMVGIMCCSAQNGKYSFKFKETKIIPVGDSANKFFDYDLDGDLDLIISGYNNGLRNGTNTHTFLYKNDGLGNFTKDINGKFMGVEYGSIDVADIDKDGDLDVVVTGQDLKRGSESVIEIYKNTKGSFKKVKSIKPLYQQGYSTFAGFINANNDDYPDLLIERDNSIEVYINRRSNFMLRSKLEGIDRNFEYGIVPFDMDSDGDDDVLVQGEMESNFTTKTILFQNNKGKYSAIDNIFKNTNQGIILKVDVDNDGDEDIFMSNVGNLEDDLGVKTSLFYMNEKGTFKEKRTHIKVYNLGKAHFVDLDNDGDKDLIIMGNRRKINKANESEDVVDIYLNTKGIFKLYKQKAFPYLSQGSINSADIDGDKDQDILITGYKGSDTPRTELYINELIK